MKSYEDIDRAVRELNPSSTDEVERSISDELRHTTLAAAKASDASAPGSPKRPRFTVGAIVKVAIPLAVLAFVAVLALPGGSGPGASGPEFAAAAVRVAENNPRYLIGQPGWEVTNVFLDEKEGGMTFENGNQSIDLRWLPRILWSDPKDLAPGENGKDTGWYTLQTNCGADLGDCHDFIRSQTLDVASEQAILTQNKNVTGGGAGDVYSVTLPPVNGVYVRVMPTSQMSRKKFLAVVASLKETDVETWLDALPAGTVKPTEQPEIVDQALEGSPIPESLDVDALRTSPRELNRLGLINTVGAAIACGWLDQWADARESGDVASAKEAIDTLATWRSWPVLQQIKASGHNGLTSTIREFSHDLVTHNSHRLRQPGGAYYAADGRTIEFGPQYAGELGCDSGTYTQRAGRRPVKPRTPVSNAYVAAAVAKAG